MGDQDVTTPSPTPSAISGIDGPEKVRVLLYANNQPVHAPLVEVVEAGAVGRLLPDGGAAGDVLTKSSGTDYDVEWSKAIGPRAWVNFDGGTPAIRDDFNVDHVTRNSTGDYTVYYSSSMGAGASVTSTAGDSTTAGVYTVNLVEINTAFANFQVRDGSGELVDVDLICVTIFGIEKNFLILSGDEQDGGLDKIKLSGDAAPGVLLLTPSAV